MMKISSVISLYLPSVCTLRTLTLPRTVTSAIRISTHSDIEQPICFNHPPPLTYDGWMHFLSIKPRRWWPLAELRLNSVIHWSICNCLDLLKASRDVKGEGFPNTSGFHIVVNQAVEVPSGFTRAIPKFDGVIGIWFEVGSERFSDS